MQKIKWDDTKRSYVYSKSGRRLGAKALKQLHYKKINSVKKEFNKLTEKLINYDISFWDWQVEAIKQIKDLTVQSLEFARGGKKRTYAVHYLEIARNLKNEHYPRLRKLFREISSGDHSPRMIRYRVNKFFNATRRNFALGRRQIAQSEGGTHAYRTLDPLADHCEDCIAHAGLGIAEIEIVPLPGERCRCADGCKCSIHFGTFGQLLAQRGFA